MATIAIVCHRTPYPPNKGDKIHAWHVVKHLTGAHDVHLLYIEDMAEDAKYQPLLASVCASAMAIRTTPFLQKGMALRGLFTGDALTVAAYPQRRLKTAVQELVENYKPDLVIAISGAMGGAAKGSGLPFIMDFVDIDSLKWKDYAKDAAWTMSWLYRREYKKLAALEQILAGDAAAVSFVTDDEVALFKTAYTGSKMVRSLPNGVDTDLFNPAANNGVKSPHPSIIFTGMMAYAPNVDAVQFFAQQCLPQIRAKLSDTRFIIAGSPVAPAVQALAKLDGVDVLGRVEEMAPHIASAWIAAIPIGTARGVQNKVLEALACGLPVVASSGAATGITDEPHEALIVADTKDDIIEACLTLLRDPQRRHDLGTAARSFALSDLGWAKTYQQLDGLLEEVLRRRDTG